MKRSIWVTVLFFSFLEIPSILSQNKNWNIALNFHATMDFMQQSNDKGINIKHRNTNRVGSSSGIGLSIIRRIEGPWHLGVEVGRLKSTYKLNLDRDFGDLDNFIRFSEPTIEGDYQNIDKIEYNNVYFRWTFCPYYYFNYASDQSVHTYLGIGYEQRRLRKSEVLTTYRDLISYNFFGEDEPTHVPAFSQKTEANNYYNDTVVESASFLNIKFGIKIYTSESFAMIFEPYYTTSLKNYQPKMLASQWGLGINFMLNALF